MPPAPAPSRPRYRRRALLLALLLGLAAAPLPTLADTAPRPAQLSAQDRAEVQRVQDYLNGIRTLSGRFQQYSSDGGVAQGTVYVSRPGRMRFEYDPPVPILIVADGRSIYYWDKELQHLQELLISSTPVWFLLSDHLTLGGDVTITRLERGPGVIRITLVETKDPSKGTVTLIFSDNPLQLRQWSIVDAENKTTTVTLADTRFDSALDPALFRFVDPREPKGR